MQAILNKVIGWFKLTIFINLRKLYYSNVNVSQFCRLELLRKAAALTEMSTLKGLHWLMNNNECFLFPDEYSSYAATGERARNNS